MLEHRKRNLPEQATVDTLTERLTDLEKRLGEQQAVFDEIASRQKKLDGDIDSLRAKIDGEQKKMDSGDVTSARELAALHAEIESIKRRVTTLEDADLDVMEEKETAEKELDALKRETDSVAAEVEQATNARDRASGQIDAELAEARSERAEFVPKVDPELLELYDDIRASRAGIGAAPLQDGTCQGCHMKLPAQEVARIQKEKGLQRCEECRRILVVV